MWGYYGFIGFKIFIISKRFLVWVYGCIGKVVLKCKILGGNCIKLLVYVKGEVST